MLVPQTFNITRRSEKPYPLPKFNHGDDDVNLRVAIRQEGGEGGGSEGGSDAGGDAGGGDAGGIGDAGAGIGEDGSIGDGYGGSEGGGTSSEGGSEISTSSGGGKSPAVISGGGGGPPTMIPSGAPFEGRIAGGGTRASIFGDSQYGSGYPNTTGRGTAGRGLPFYFWPVVWAGNGTGYLYPTDYGLPTNTSRPGGALVTSVFSSNTTNTTFRILSDNQTVIDLISTITSPCSSNLQTTHITPTAYNDSSTFPKPEQAIQYYRASSIVLTLDGYNNTADLTNATSNVPLPSNIDQTLLNCVNSTIGTTAPLVNAASGSGAVPTTGLLGLAWIVWMLLYLW